MFLIDGDIIIYRVACAAEDESEKVVLGNLFSYVHGIIAQAHAAFEVELQDVTIYLSDSTENNFRNEFAVTAEYKAGRPDKPRHYAAVKQALIDKYEAIVTEGQEADDAIAIGATQNPGSVLCSIDKDFLQVAGTHYNWVKREITEVSEEDGLRLLYSQILTGDRVDNIQGIHGVGEVKARKILEPCDDEKDLFEREKCYFVAAVKAYQEKEGLKLTEARARVYEVARLVYLRRQPGEIWVDPYER